MKPGYSPSSHLRRSSRKIAATCSSPTSAIQASSDGVFDSSSASAIPERLTGAGIPSCQTIRLSVRSWPDFGGLVGKAQVRGGAKGRCFHYALAVSRQLSADAGPVPGAGVDAESGEDLGL